MADVVMPLPELGFDPSEAAIIWKSLKDAGHSVVFATPSGNRAAADPIMVTGKGLGPLARAMRADTRGREAYAALEKDPAFAQPIPYARLKVADYGALGLTGGHAKGMRPYLESALLQAFVAEFIESDKPVAAICHGVLLAARSRATKAQVSGKPTPSVISGRRVTGLPRWMEMFAWNLTRLWMGDYYRTYPISLEDEVRSLLDSPSHFAVGPRSFKRDTPGSLADGFVIQDGNLLTARWPGDAHRLGAELVSRLPNSN